ncbi:L protein [Hainan oriental leaf-toed gecko hantavirus]|uniref:RNA-directed RNA polymerase L n=1 Tax=Hainan oriental leaf-toed gecko hantavirus TaxID=2116437 RepID=A0A2P1GNU6_9VIRU|nr:L protein [Hainan oriental leaf-toed gecko hantavirus]AVM87653.1 L protein [Hainan oriental leaf-toed gecko hantavirus]
MQSLTQLTVHIQGLEPGTVNAQDCAKLLDDLYMCRHNVIDDRVKQQWSDNLVETKISDVLLRAGIPPRFIDRLSPKVIPGYVSGKTYKKFFRMTPDNFKLDGDLISFVEITVVTDVNRGTRDKIDKYMPGFDYLNMELKQAFTTGELERLWNIKFRVIASTIDGANLTSQWPEGDTRGLTASMREIRDLMAYVREHLIRPEERAALEHALTLKFNITTKYRQPAELKDYGNTYHFDANIQDLVEYLKTWINFNSNFTFEEVKPTIVAAAFTQGELEQSRLYNPGKPKNYLLVQASVTKPYIPSTILTARIQTLCMARVLANIDQDIIAQRLIQNLCVTYLNLTDEEINAYYSPTHDFKPTANVPQPGCVNINVGTIDPESRLLLEHVTKSKEPLSIPQGRIKLLESLQIVDGLSIKSALINVEMILSQLEMPLGRANETSTIHCGKRTYVDKVLGNFLESELEKFFLKAVNGTCAWHVAHLLRDITEALIAHSGLKRSKYFSFQGFGEGDTFLIIFPAKSLETAASAVKFCVINKKGHGLIDRDHVLFVTEIDGDTYIASKVMTLDLTRLMALNNAFEKTLLATATWFQEYVEDQNQFPSKRDLISIFSFHLLLSCSQKMKVCALFDNLRYLIPSCTAQYSGYQSLIKSFCERMWKTNLELYIYRMAKQVLIACSQTNRQHLFSKVKIHGITIDYSTVGASGNYKSIISNAHYKHYKALISEATTCFFLFEKGLHGVMPEEAKIHTETVEWMAKFVEKEERYTALKVESGFFLNEGKIPVEQQLFCVDVVVLAATELNKALETKGSQLQSNLNSKPWQKGYFSQTRNISLKGMSGPIQEDFHLKSSVTLIEAIRYLSTHQDNPTVFELYDQLRFEAPKARIVRKYQRTEADRGFFIVDLPTRVKLEIIEDYYDAIASCIPEEYISYGGEKKVQEIQRTLERALRWASGKSTLTTASGIEIVFKRKLMYVSADSTKWSPGDNSAKFRWFTSVLNDGLDETKLKHCVIDALTGIYETDFFMSRKLKAYITSMEVLNWNVETFLANFFENEATSLKVRGNWLQGNLNKCSSTFAVAISLLFKKCWQLLFPELDSFFEFAHHSDDALFVYGYLEPVENIDAWYEYNAFKIQSGSEHWHLIVSDTWKGMFKVHEHLFLMGSIKISPKKTTVSPTNAEFISTFFEGCAVSIPYSKILLGTLSDLPGLGYFDDLAAGQSRCVKALDTGCSPQVAQLALGVATSKIERLYGVAPGMSNDPCYYMPLQRNEIPVPLGGSGSASVLELATAGVGMSDKSLLSLALDLRGSGVESKMKKGQYILGLFKFLMNLSEETFDHEQLGEFSFMGKVQWKLFVPKDDVEFSDFISSHLVRQWAADHPAYEFIIPRDRNNLLFYLVKRLQTPSIMIALVKQSALQLRYRMFAKQHMEVCKYGEQWARFSIVLAAADIFAENYTASPQDVDLFRTLTKFTFSKELAWKDFLNNLDCTVVNWKRARQVKSAKTFIIREKEQAVQNQISVIIARKIAKTPEEISDVVDLARVPEALSNDIRVLTSSVYRELGLSADDTRIMLRIAPLLYKSARNRVVLVPANCEATAESICLTWVKEMSFIKTLKVQPKKSVLPSSSIFTRQYSVEPKIEIHAMRLCCEFWRWCKVNDVKVTEWFPSLFYEGKTFTTWISLFHEKGLPKIDPESQCGALMMYDLKGSLNELKNLANRKAFSGKSYDAYCRQIYNPLTDQYEGDLRVTLNFGIDCAALEIFWDDRTYTLETSITERQVLNVMMGEVSNELIRCGMRFVTTQSSGSGSFVLFKTERGFQWGKPRGPCVIFHNVFRKPSLRRDLLQIKDFKITILENGFRALCQADAESPRVHLAHIMHSLKDIRYQSVQAVGSVYYKGLYLNPLITAGHLESFLKALPATIPPSAYKLILSKAQISVDLFMFNEILHYINPLNTLNLQGLERAEGYSTISNTSGIATQMTLEFDVEDPDENEDDVFCLDDLDFEQIDFDEDVKHFLSSESAYADELTIMVEQAETSKFRGLTKLNDPLTLIKSWVSRSYFVDKKLKGTHIMLVCRYLSKHFQFGLNPVKDLDPYDLTELEAVVKGWGELLHGEIEKYDEKAKEELGKFGYQIDEMEPDNLFNWKFAHLVFKRLFKADSVSSFY